MFLCLYGCIWGHNTFTTLNDLMATFNWVTHWILVTKQYTYVQIIRLIIIMATVVHCIKWYHEKLLLVFSSVSRILMNNLWRMEEHWHSVSWESYWKIFYYIFRIRYNCRKYLLLGKRSIKSSISLCNKMMRSKPCMITSLNGIRYQ